MRHTVLIFYERKEPIKADFLDTQNMCVRRIENFLQASENVFYLQIWGKKSLSRPDWEFLTRTLI